MRWGGLVDASLPMSELDDDELVQHAPPRLRRILRGARHVDRNITIECAVCGVVFRSAKRQNTRRTCSERCRQLLSHWTRGYDADGLLRRALHLEATARLMRRVARGMGEELL